jgi:DNA invertase Pin-like site-specific DNA recombinase
MSNKNRLIGYARVSTVGQDHASQIDALNAAGVAELFQEKISGAAPFAERLQLQAALATLEPGDVLVLTKLDRLGRTMEEAVSRVAELLDRGCHVRTLDGRVDTLGLGKMAKLVVGILAAAAEIERDLILERTAEGRQRAQAGGVKFGRKRSYRPEQAALVLELADAGDSHRVIAKKTGLSATTVRRVLGSAVAA